MYLLLKKKPPHDTYERSYTVSEKRISGVLSFGKTLLVLVVYCRELAFVQGSTKVNKCASPKTHDMQNHIKNVQQKNLIHYLKTVKIPCSGVIWSSLGFQMTVYVYVLI